MQIYFAPLEGITSYTYRNLHHQFYGGVEKYYTPFLSPGPVVGLGPKELKDVLSENNQGVTVIPQIMTNRAEDFIRSARILESFGYREININLGCPSGTVVAKKKGSGLLFYPEELDRFLDEVFSDPLTVNGSCEVSVKTRIGKNSPGEWPEIMRIYNQYPMKELIIHPRIQKDFYRNEPNLEVFEEALKESRNPVVYNGDITSVEALHMLHARFPQVKTVMLGRGLIRNPQLAEFIMEDQNQDLPDMQRLRLFHDGLLKEYETLMSGERNVLFRMKDIWFYMLELFPGKEKTAKQLRKSTRLSEYKSAVDELFA